MFTDLKLLSLDDKPGYFMTLCLFSWQHEKLPGGVYVVPQGFETNLASIPWGMRSLFSVNGRSRKPAVMHDNMYARQWETRAICDDMFRLALVERGMSRWKARLMWSGVRAGGWTRGRW